MGFSARRAAVAAVSILAASGWQAASPAKADTRISERLSRCDERDQAVDLMQITGDRAYYLDESNGLLIYDISDVDHPRLIGRHGIVGGPIGIHVHGFVAAIVMKWSDVSRSGTSFQGPALVRLLDARDPTHLAVLGERAIEGEVRDARAVADSMYIVSELSDAAGGPQVIVTSLRFEGRSAFAVRSLRRDGTAGSLRAVGDRLVLAYADREQRGTHVEVWVDSPTAGLLEMGSIGLPATIERGDRDTSPRIDAPDMAHVRILGCRTPPCEADDPLEVSTVEIADSKRPRISFVHHVRSPGAWMATRFEGARLYLFRGGWRPLGSPPSTVSMVDLDASPYDDRRQLVEGSVWSLLPVGQRLVLLSTRGDPYATRDQVVLSAIDAHARRPPGALSDAVLGDGWASSSATGSSRAIAVCGGSLAASYRTWQPASAVVQSRVSFVDWSEQGLTPWRDVAVQGAVERLACLQDRLLVMTDIGLWSVDLRRKRSAGALPKEPSLPGPAPAEP